MGSTAQGKTHIASRPAPPDFQLGNGLFLACLHSRIKEATRFRRSHNAWTKAPKSSTRASYHSGGIRAAASSRISQSRCDKRVRNGSNECRPLTPAYTAGRGYTPRAGASGKSHSEALKQK